MDRTNLAHWEQLAVLHGTGVDHYYDLEKLVAGGTLMGDEETAALVLATAGAGVDGRDVLHLQCQIGCDASSMARQGANVTGVDCAPTAAAGWARRVGPHGSLATPSTRGPRRAAIHEVVTRPRRRLTAGTA